MHTPGPWTVGGASGNGGEAREIVSRSRCIAWTACSYDEDAGDVVTAEDDANACLIAAAPDLLEACELLLIYLADWDDKDDGTCATARRAIAKATGKEVPNG